MQRSRAEIEADLAALYAARSKLFAGGQVTEVTHSSGGTKKQVLTLSEINEAIAMLQLELAQVIGGTSGLGPVRFGFGGRT